MKKLFAQAATVMSATTVLCLFNPSTVRADATASGQLSFSNVAITPGAGTFQFVTNWQGSAFAQATVAGQYNSGPVPSATALGDFSQASGQANANVTNGQSSANGSVLGQTASDNAAGQSSLTSWFIITGGSGNVVTTFSAQIGGSLSVLTDAYGELASAETIFSLEANGNPILFDDRLLSIGASDGNSQTFSTLLSSTMTLQYNTPYALFIQADSEISISNVPEPGTIGLIAVGTVVLIALGRNRRRLKSVATATIFSSLMGVSQAMYIGGDAPDVCQKCGLPATRLAGGAVSTSLTEGNLREDYPVAALQSSGGPTLQLTLAYNSYNADGSRAQVDSGLGLGWTHAYNTFLFQQRGSYFRMGSDGRVTLYHLGAGASYTADTGFFETLKPQADGSLIITNKQQSWWRFTSVPNTPFLVGGPVYRLTQLGDRDGNLTTLAYSNGLLTKITDTYGRFLTLGYTNQHLATVVDPLGRTTRFQYDSKYRTPVRITDPDGKVTRYTYNSLYQMTKKIDRDGRTYFYLYRGMRPWSVLDGNGQVWLSLANSNNWAVNRNNLALTMRRNYFPSTATTTDGNGNVWRYQYDTNGYINRVTAPDGSSSAYAYDAQTRQLAAMTNANGAVTRYQYDANGNRTNLTDALGNVTTYTYELVYSQMTSMTDPNGRTTTYQYDARGNRTNEIDPLLQTESWSYDANGNILSRTDKNGHTTTYSYDSFGDRTNMIDAAGNMTRYTYDAVGNLITTTDPLGRTTSYSYDALDRPIRQTNTLGGVTSYSYDALGRMTTNSDALGRVTTYAYDTRGRLVQTTDALGGATTYSYDPNNNRLSTTNQLGNATTYAYDSLNRQITTTDALGNVTTFAYDPVGNLTNSLDPLGRTTTYTYDALNRQTAVTDPLGGVTRYDYAAVGGPSCCSPTVGSSLITRREDADGHVTFYTYDELDRMTQVIRKQGSTNDTITANDAVTTYAYDAVGNRISVTDPAGNATIYSYDALNRTIGETNAAGDVTASAYDPVGNVIAGTAPNGNVTSFIYDGLNRVTTTYDGSGPISTNTYDAVNNLLSSTDANGHTTSYIYDSLNRRVTTTDALGQTATYVYDGVGNLTTSIDRNGRTSTYAYDALNRRTATTDANGNTTVSTYDAVGNVTHLTDANGHVTTYSYDSLNRRVVEAYPDAPPNTVTYAYDSVGNLIRRTDQLGQVTTYSYSDLYYMTNRSYLPSGSRDNFTYDLSGRMLSADRNGWTNTFGYDGASRLVYTTQNGQLLTYTYDIIGRHQTNTYPSGRSIGLTMDGRSRLMTEQAGINPPIVTYTYDAANRVITRVYRNGTTTTYTYDADDRITSLEHSNSVGRVAGFAYDYDAEGNRLDELKRHASGDSEAYSYDAINRLVDYRVGTLAGTTIPAPAVEKSYNLDPVGNWNTVVSNSVTETRTHGPANELLTANAQTYAYDADGNLQVDSLYAYSYDEENRLTQIQRLTDSAIVGRYFYDALGRRIIMIVKPAVVATTNVFYYDHARLVEEQNGNGVPQATYVYGNYVDDVLTMDRSGQTFYYHQNSLWSPHALTDASGNVVERYTYDAYGEVIVLNASYLPLSLNAWGTPHSAVGNPYLFTGRELDEESGLYFYRARFYDDVKGRFLQRDPAGYVEGLNLYEYVGGNPVGHLDPTGLFWYWAKHKGDDDSLAVSTIDVTDLSPGWFGTSKLISWAHIWGNDSGASASLGASFLHHTSMWSSYDTYRANNKYKVSFDCDSTTGAVSLDTENGPKGDPANHGPLKTGIVPNWKIQGHNVDIEIQVVIQAGGTVTLQSSWELGGKVSGEAKGVGAEVGGKISRSTTISWEGGTRRETKAHFTLRCVCSEK